MPVTESPLRYPGGKTQLLKFLEHTLNINKMEKVVYCEPFSGGFGAGLGLLFSRKVDKVIINDFDMGIYSVWYAILNDFEKFKNKIVSLEISINEWKKQKEAYNMLINSNNYSIELAVATLFLNRTNRSGIIQGGPIGGIQQESTYKIDCRFNINSIIKKINNINERKSDITLYNLEANTLINDVLLEENIDRLFTFFDPPYFIQGKNLYTNFFNYEDHIKLKNNISMMDNFKWITTYDKTDEIRELFKEYPCYEYKIQYSANKKRKETELLFSSPITKIESKDKVVFCE